MGVLNVARMLEAIDTVAILVVTVNSHLARCGKNLGVEIAATTDIATAEACSNAFYAAIFSDTIL